MKSLNLFHHLCCTLLRIVAVGCAVAVITVLPTMLTSRAETVAPSPAVDRGEAGDSGAQANLADVADGVLFDGWGNAAVRSLSMYYSPDASRGDVQMLGYRASFLPVFDWANGVIDTEAGSDLFSFYATGNGAGRVQSPSDPAYAFSYVTRYQEPAGRINGRNGAGYALSMGAAQSRTVTSDYQNWSDADLSTASGINTATLQSEFNTTSSYGGFGASLTTFGQRISDPTGVTSLSRQAWQDANAAPASAPASKTQTTSDLWSGRNAAFDSALPSTLVPPPGVSGTMSAVSQRLLGNYFRGGEQSGFIRSKVAVDVLGQWGFAYDPNLEGSSHLFRDDAGRVRFLRANPDLTNVTSQGFRYVKYDQWSRPIEFGVLLNVAKKSLEEYAQWARQADLDMQLTGANSCPVIKLSYDVDPTSGIASAYDEGRGKTVKLSYYPTAIADQPTACPGRETNDPIHESLYRYDDLARTSLLSEHRRNEESDVYRTTGRSWPSGGVLAQMTFPDKDQTQAFTTSGQGSVTTWPNLLGRDLRLCSGEDCSGVKYYDIAEFDWMSAPLSVVAGNGVNNTYAYDFRGLKLSQSASLDGTLLFEEELRNMQIADNENPCPGSTSSPDYSAGLIIARSLSGAGLPSADQGVWDCYIHDGALRLKKSNRYEQDGGDWDGVSSYAYAFDDSGNLETTTQSAKGVLLKVVAAVLGENAATTYIREGSDKLTSASLASGDDLTFSYDPAYGTMTSLRSSGTGGFELSLTPDAVLQRPMSQSVTDIASGATLLSAAISYDANGLRASRKVTAGSEGSGSSATTYWYGGGLHPIVVDRDGVTYRMIGKMVIEQIGVDDGVTRSYLHADHSDSVRMITNDGGQVISSLGYAGDWGLTSISGQANAASYSDMASFYRFQGQEQEIFPLANLKIEDESLAAWLDGIQLYHYPLRDYAAGLSVFLETDPFPTEDSLYAAFGANPANYTDPSGGMIQLDDAEIFERARRIVATDPLLDQLVANPAIQFPQEDRRLLWRRLRDELDILGEHNELIGAFEQAIQQVDEMVAQTRRLIADLQRARIVRWQADFIHQRMRENPEHYRRYLHRMSAEERGAYFERIRGMAQAITRMRNPPEVINAELSLIDTMRRRARLARDLDELLAQRAPRQEWMNRYGNLIAAMESKNLNADVKKLQIEIVPDPMQVDDGKDDEKSNSDDSAAPDAQAAAPRPAENINAEEHHGFHDEEKEERDQKDPE